MENQDQNNKNVYSCWSCKAGGRGSIGWGVLFLALGIYFIARDLGYISGDLSFWSVALTAFGLWLVIRAAAK